MIKVAAIQRGNKLIEYLGTTPWHYDASCSADYEINLSTYILFLSLKFHNAKPEYIHRRIAKLKDARIQVLIVLIDTPNFNTTLQELFRTVSITIVLCRTYEECAKYIRGFEICSKRSSDVLRRKESTINVFLQTLGKVNKTDSVNLQSHFSTLREILMASERELSSVQGIGRTKAEQLKNHLNKPFKD